MAAIGLGATLLLFLMSLKEHDLMPFISLGVIAFLIGLGLVINGLAFTVPRRGINDRFDEAESQRELESRIQAASSARQLSPLSQSTNDLSAPADRIMSQPSVTEHTTHHLKPHKS